jgi:hypothetical protein
MEERFGILPQIMQFLGTISQLFRNPHCSHCYETSRCYAASRKVAGLIPDGVIKFFDLPKPSSCNVALRSTQPLSEMSTTNFPGGKGRRARKTDNLNAICQLIV